MSDKAKAIVWDYYEPRDWGRVPIITVSALADSADDHGAGISAPVSEMAGKTRQADRTVQRHLRLLQQLGLLELVESTKGGGGREGNTYRLNLAALVSRNRGDILSPSRVTNCHPQQASEGDTVSPSENTPYISSNKEMYVEGAADVTLSEGAEDRRLAKWMFERLQALKPNFREPNWQAWSRDLRLMRTRDKRTRREIAVLFAWVNADPFWQTNVLCPHTLRKQWDRLELQRMAKMVARGVPAAAVAVDHRCVGPREGEKCPGGRQGTSSDGPHANAPWRCDVCRDEMERERALAS